MNRNNKNKNKNNKLQTLDKYLNKKTKNNFIANKIAEQLKNATAGCSDAIETTKKNDQSSTEIGTADTTSTTTETEQNVFVLQKRLKISENNLKVAKSLLRKQSELNMSKDLRIIELSKQNENSSNKNTKLFEKYSNHFRLPDMLKLRSIGPGEGKDSSFVYTLLKLLYKNDSEKLKNRSATGRKFKGISKLEITFEKKKIMQNMLNERVGFELCGCLENTNEHTKRVGSLNKLLRHAINNFVRKGESSRKVNCNFLLYIN